MVHVSTVLCTGLAQKLSIHPTVLIGRGPRGALVLKRRSDFGLPNFYQILRMSVVYHSIGQRCSSCDSQFL